MTTTTKTTKTTSEETEAVEETPIKITKTLLTKITSGGRKLTKSDAEGAKKVRETKTEVFETSCDSYSEFGALLMSPDIAGKINADNGTAIHKALIDPESAIYGGDKDDFVSAPIMSRAVAIFRRDNADRRKAFVATKSALDLSEYVQWLSATVAFDDGKDLADPDVRSTIVGNKSSVDLAASIVTDDKGNKSVGKLVRPSKPKSDKTTVTTTKSTVEAPIESVVPEFGKYELMSDDELAAIPTVADFGEITDEQREMIARQMIAELMINRRSVKRSELLTFKL
jgi:hypothetical protein